MIKCVAIDDEPIALNIISEHCRRYGGMELECFSSPVAEVKYLEDNRPDVLFLDIEMPRHNGMEIARMLPPGICVIFTSAYAQYALDGFNVNAVDFLHKPIFYPRFRQAMDKALKWFNLDRQQTHENEGLALRSDHRDVFVPFSEIVFVEALENYAKIYRKTKPTLLSQITMKELEQLLPADRFMRVHRSYIVSLAQVTKYANRNVLLADADEPIPVGRKYHEDFNRWYGLNI